MISKDEYTPAKENELNRLRIREERQAIGDGSGRRIQQGENEYKPFGKKNNEELINSYNYLGSYLGMLCDAQANIRVAIEGLKQGKEVLGTYDELILIELDIEFNLIKLKNIAVGRKDIIK